MYADTETCRLNQKLLVPGTNQGGSTFMNIRAITQGGFAISRQKSPFSVKKPKSVCSREGPPKVGLSSSRRHDAAFSPLALASPLPIGIAVFRPILAPHGPVSKLQLSHSTLPRAPQPQPQRALFSSGHPFCLPFSHLPHPYPIKTHTS